MSATTPRILFATDFSPASAMAFAETRVLARARAASVTLLHIIPITSDLDAFVPLASSAQMLVVEEAAERELVALARALDEDGIATDCKVLLGDPRSDVLTCARELQPDLIIIGTHGRRGLERLLLGSVAERIVHLSSWPVLVVPGQAAVASRTVPSEPPLIPSVKPTVTSV